MLFINLENTEKIGLSHFFRDEWLDRPIEVLTVLFKLKMSSSHSIWDSLSAIKIVRNNLACYFDINEFRIVFFEGNVEGSSGEYFFIIPSNSNTDNSVKLSNLNIETSFFCIILKESTEIDNPIDIEYFEALFRISFDNHIISQHLFTFKYNFEYAKKDGRGKTYSPIKIYSTPFNHPNDSMLSFLKSIDTELTKIESIALKNRMKLSLSWFSKNISTNSLDKFIYFWVAIETLTMHSADIKSLKITLSNAYNVSISDIEKHFSIGRIYNLRCKIFHEGFTPKLDYNFLYFCDLLYIDVLYEMLGVPCQELSFRHLHSVQFDVKNYLVGLIS